MWISKRDWEKMCEKIDGLERANIKTCKEIYPLKISIEANESTILECVKLLDAHKKVTSNEYKCIRGGENGLSQGINYETKTVYDHEVDCVSTKDVSDITLEELAKLVIDGTPIVREETSKVKKEYGMKGCK